MKQTSTLTEQNVQMPEQLNHWWDRFNLDSENAWTNLKTMVNPGALMIFENRTKLNQEDRANKFRTLLLKQLDSDLVMQTIWIIQQGVNR